MTTGRSESPAMDPLVFEPFFRPQVWGGRRLERFLGRPLPGEGPFGEAWVLSAQSLHVSRVAEGPFRGMLLSELWASQTRDIAGPGWPVHGAFPLLFKYLDCQELLSIQVHPNDQLARRLCPRESGKTEAWVILEAEPGSRIYAGLRPGTTRQDLERHLTAGTLAECLHAFVPQKGQCIFMPAGTLHAVGGGVLMAEVQQSSDATFRLFDWNRLGADGKPRQLHTEAALQSIDWSAGPVRPTPGVPIPGLSAGVQGERLAACPHFSIDRFRLAGPLDLPYPGRFSVWMVLEGSAVLSSATSGFRRVCRMGETILSPASAVSLQWEPSGREPATLLGVVSGSRTTTRES